ncbi:Putative serine/threonine-protein kinase nek3 [Durusdinium trenchii]|uniref:Serine/threonine-protein kinase nek3 n=1 Tax=Durusdinium trenchii TaxID=1381693 RepID=A0ABP0MBN2_9DINO
MWHLRKCFFILLPIAVLTWFWLCPVPLWEATPSKPDVEVKPFAKELHFLLLINDFSTRADTNFALQLAQELVSLGHQVVLESPVDGMLLKDLEPQPGLVARVNPRLETVLSGQNDAFWDAIQGELPHFIVCFSSLWNASLYRLSDKHPGVRLVWYFYKPLACDSPKESTQHRNKVGYAMATADTVVFARDADRQEWLQHDRGHFATFRIFAPATNAPGDDENVSFREEIRARHGIKPNDFVITVVNDLCPRMEMSFSSSGIVQTLQRKFQTSWFAVVFGEYASSQAASSENLFFASDRRELVKYLAAADLHVSLAWPDFATDTLYARSFGVPVLMPLSELAGENSIDCFTLRTLTQQSLQKEVANVISLSARKRFSVGRAGRFAVQARFQGQVVTVRVTHLINILQLLPHKSGRAEPRVGVFVQLHDPSRWHQLWPCVRSVLQAAGNNSVDVLLTTTQPIQTLRRAMAELLALNSGALRFTLLSRAENRGADIGVFLQQLLLARELSLDADLILKVHTKKRKAWRDLMIQPLCGSVEAVRGIIDQFMGDDTVGMIGPTNLTWKRVGPFNHVALNLSLPGFDKHAIKQMEFAWSLMHGPGVDLPPQRTWLIVAGSFYWMRVGLQVWEEQILPLVPRLLCSMGVYGHGCRTIRCQAALGLERIIPTLVGRTHKVATP